jgi:long-chain acyl-CoA synthetase
VIHGVILSEAKNLNIQPLKAQILRVAQNDNRFTNILYFCHSKNMELRTLQDIFFARTTGHDADNLYVHYKRQRGELYRALSYKEFGDRVRAFAASLAAIGVADSERILIASESSPEWTVTDFAAILTGAVSVPVYPTLTAKQVEYILKDSGAIAAVVSNDFQLRKILASLPATPALKHIIVMDTSVSLPELSGVTFYYFSELEREGILRSFERRNPSEEDLVTIIYTSGTTGEPKGVMLTHRNLVSNVHGALDSIPPVRPSDIFLSFLPLSHAFERIASYFLFFAGAQVAYAESIESMAENMVEIRPTIMTAVPRFFERLHSRIMSTRGKMPIHRRMIFDWGVRTGKAYAKKIERLPVSLYAKTMFPLANKVVLSKIRSRTGGRIRFLISGGAALNPEIGRTFAAFGLTILEGYGLTETSPVVAVNRVDSLQWGSVGKPLPGVEVGIAEDGEILIRGANVMKGYFNDDKETAEMIDSEGWLHSGDIGVLSAEGILKITDRKKNIIVLANGKNITPTKIEVLLEESPFIEQAVVVGEKKDYCGALLVSTASTEQLQAEINRVNKDLAAFEKLRKFATIAEPFTIENGMMTPTLKIRRKEVEKRYGELIESLYK